MQTWHITFCALLVLIAAVARAADDTGWKADPALAERLGRDRPDILFDEAKVPKYELPDILKSADGQVVQTPEQWPKRRGEILELFRAHVFGRMPGKPQELRFESLEEDARALEGTATLRRVAIHSTQDRRTHKFELLLFTPNAPGGPRPVFLLIDNRSNRPATSQAASQPTTRSGKSDFWPAAQLVARGYATAEFMNGQLAPDDPKTFCDGVIKLYEGEDADSRPADACGALGAWAWGASRVMDYLETDPRVDPKKVAVVGHSRGGKASLWAGANDERFAMVVSNSSGEGGASLTRRRFGETIAAITTRFPHWFCRDFNRFAGKEDDLPVDAHMLMALTAPRALYVTSHGDDLWADPRGEYLALAHASHAYALFGAPPLAPDPMPPLDRPVIAGVRGYHIHTGKHNLEPFDWQRFMDFADGLWKAQRDAP